MHLSAAEGAPACRLISGRLGVSYFRDQLIEIFDRSGGQCHLCDKQVAFTNYACAGARGAWEVDHSRPKAHGGSCRLNNLRAACIDCNREKGTLTTRTVRRRNGLQRAPLSRQKRLEGQRWNTLGGVALGVIGAALLIGAARAWSGRKRDRAALLGRSPDGS